MTALNLLLIVIAALGIMTSTLLTISFRALKRTLALQASTPSRTLDEVTPSDFSPALRRADLQIRLQQGQQRREPPEKYGFIKVLAEHGLPPAEMARILSLAASEVEQLLALAQVARRQPKTVAKRPRAKKGRALINAKDSVPAAETLNR